jgi:hypothetical protein
LNTCALDLVMKRKHLLLRSVYLLNIHKWKADQVFIVVYVNGSVPLSTSLRIGGKADCAM